MLNISILKIEININSPTKQYENYLFWYSSSTVSFDLTMLQLDK